MHGNASTNGNRYMKNVLLLTALPFRRVGNQSLIRFVKMLMKNDINLTLVSSGTDEKGTQVLKDDLLQFHSFKSFLYKQGTQAPVALNQNYNPYTQLESNKETLLYTSKTIKAYIKKRIRYYLIIIDNLSLILYLLLDRSIKLRTMNAVIGYETSYTIAAKILSVLFRKKYINKFQGVALKSSNRNLSICRRFYPDVYRLINKADLCLMVNDGTDGEFYAAKRGNKNIYNETHGVNAKEYDSLEVGDVFTEYSGKVIFFNNASPRFMKRVDRFIRPLQYVSEDLLDKCIFITTYNGADKKYLINLRDELGLTEYVHFVEGWDHLKSNAGIRAADVLVSVNDTANIGNPVLEALYYRTPIITIKDDPILPYFREGTDGWLINLENFDQEYAEVVENIINNPEMLNKMRSTPQNKIGTLEQRQELEFSHIKKLLND